MAKRRQIARRTLAIALALFVMSFAGTAIAGHNGAVVGIAEAECGETTFTASIADPDGTHVVDNMYLVVHADGETQSEGPIPTDGSSVSITVGPFDDQSGTETLQWRVFGGGERSYDQPLWNGYGDPDFAANIGAYGAENGYGFVLAGPDDPNPFTTWNEVEAETCPPPQPESKDDCKKGGWEAFGFKNQGQCIKFVNTGMDSR
jgi:hypothetical protein